MTCQKCGANLRKCVPFYVIGGVLIIIGLPLMITGIAANFVPADLLGYIGGICIFFGLGFFLLWHAFTTESVELSVPTTEFDPSISNIRDIIEKSRKREEISRNASGLMNNGAYVNLGYEGKVEKPHAKEARVICVTDDIELIDAVISDGILIADKGVDTPETVTIDTNR